MNNDRENHILYRVISLLFVGLVIIIVGIDISGKYFQQGIALFSIDSPLIFPLLIFLTLVISLIFELRTEIKKILSISSHYRKEQGIEKDKDLFQTKNIINIFIFIVISLVYIYILPELHFIAATSLYMFCIMVVINDTDKIFFKLAKAFLATGITIPIIYYVFYDIFGVILP
ncbi:MAG: tripartite tricarboxylate transporter TctB family protein [Candidatus Atribacteria bacterium]|nr:tripartite tricarboxylate transporter TctB family protein [Candidatus Atribacteria bacterium]